MRALVLADALGVVAIRFDRRCRHVFQIAIEIGAGSRGDGDRRGDKAFGRIGPLGHRELRSDSPCEIVDGREEIRFARGLDPFCTHDPARRGFLQFDIDANRFARLHVAAEQNAADSGAPCQFPYSVEGDHSIVLPLHVREDLHEAIGPQHFNVGRLRQVGHQHVGEARSQPIELRIPGVVLEIQNGY